MSRTLNSIFDLEFTSRMLVEASAGTGKTYTIEGMVVRLLVERSVSIENILTVTFTRMATKELKYRILNKLRESVKALESETGTGDEFLKNLYRRYQGDANALENLRHAIQNFDDAHIYTIHGFCQKILHEETLLCGSPFELEVVQSDPYLVEAVSDFWRSFIDENSRDAAGRYYINKIQALADTPEQLASFLAPLLQNRDAYIEGAESIEVKRYLNSVLSLREEMREVWIQERETILTDLFQSNISGMTENTVRKQAEKIDLFFSDNHFTSDDFPNLHKWNSTYLGEDANLTSKGTQKPGHPFFDIAGKYLTLLGEMPKVSSTFIRYSTEQILNQRDTLIKRTSSYTYDDLLYQVRNALRRNRTGDALAHVLREKYPVALVDEFQDTDPVQYEIFDRIYPKSADDTSLLIIGDPKQAIYGFRGADIYAYLRARRGAESSQHYTLERNFRSTARLIEGVNQLFTHTEDSFVEEQIRFLPSKAGLKNPGDAYNVDGDNPSPIQIFYKPGIENVDTVKRTLFGETARQVADLIAQGNRGEVILEGSNLTGGDIAILIGENRDAETLKELLKEEGVDAVTYSRQNVFETSQADILLRFMEAVLEPTHPGYLHNLLVSGFLGSEISHLYSVRQDDHQMQILKENLLEMKDLWEKKGFYTAFRKMMMEQGGLRNLSAFYNSERIITNLYQLAELSAFAERDDQLDGPSLVHWLQRQIRDAGNNQEDTLRLESDRDLVKISTIHNSKGLEFPVVFCPSLWHAKQVSRMPDGIVDYHDPEKNFERVLNIDQDDSRSRMRAYHRNLLERVAEEVRKTYVAITRAKYECRILWGATQNTIYSGLSASLFGRQRIEEVISTKKNLNNLADTDESFFADTFKKLAQQHPDLISFSVIEASESVSRSSAAAETDSVQKKEWNGPAFFRHGRALYSFSSLVHHESHMKDEPDRDQLVARYIEIPEASPKTFDIFSFPKGASAGTLIHELFEHEKFDFRNGDSGKNTLSVKETVLQYGLDERWIPVLLEMTDQVCGAVVEDLNLFEIAPDQQLRELEFHLAVHDPNMDAIYSIIRDGKPADGTPPDSLRGYLKGFIDLIVEQSGKYYIIDYKSNYLGDSPADYSRENLRESVLSAGYDLQYSFYTMALTTILRDRVDNFDYTRDFGGVAYLYIRGMKKGTDHGIWFDKPDEQVILNLEKTLKR